MFLDSQLPEADQARPPLQARMSLRRPSGALGLEWSQLRRLYGGKAVTGELRSLAAASLCAEGDAASLATHLVKALLVVDEHPTLTRCWTFRGAN